MATSDGGAAKSVRRTRLPRRLNRAHHDARRHGALIDRLAIPLLLPRDENAGGDEVGIVGVGKHRHGGELRTLGKP